MRILIYTHSWYPFVSGITHRYTQIIEQLKCDNNIVLMTPYDSPEYDGITTIRIPGCEIPSVFLNPGDKRESRIGDPSHYFQIFNTILKTCIDYKIDIIHGSGPDGIQLLLKSVSIAYNIPLVMMYHTNMVAYCRDNPIARDVGIIAQQFASITAPPDLLVLPSKAYYDDLITDNIIPQYQPYYIIPLCVDQSIFYKTEPTKSTQWTPNKTRLLYVGRIEIEKSIDTIVKTMDDSMCLCVVGQGNDKERLSAMGKDVRFIGLVNSSELRYWYSSCDIFVMPSGTETLGFVTLEAMACGAPICAYNAGGTTEIIEHNYNGLLFDNSTQLKQHIRNLVNDVRFARQMSTNGLDFVKNKTISNSVNGLFRQYKKLVKSTI